MPDNDNLRYYKARERQERQLAADANDARVRVVHLAMAERYAKLRDEMEPDRLSA